MSNPTIPTSIAAAISGDPTHFNLPKATTPEALLNSIKAAQSSLANAGVSQASEQASNAGLQTAKPANINIALG